MPELADCFCRQCGAPLARVKGRGRPRRLCTNAECRAKQNADDQAAHRARHKQHPTPGRPEGVKDTRPRANRGLAADRPTAALALYSAGLTYQQIAEQLGCSPRHVAVLLRRAREAKTKDAETETAPPARRTRKARKPRKRGTK